MQTGDIDESPTVRRTHNHVVSEKSNPIAEEKDSVTSEDNKDDPLTDEKSEKTDTPRSTVAKNTEKDENSSESRINESF